jgi:hypothetical protein
MKIALCLAGQPRFFRQGFESYRWMLLNHRDVDVFLHCWWNPEQIGQPYRVSSGHGGGQVEPYVPEILKGLYEPKRALFQEQVSFDTTGFHVDGNYENPHLFANFSWPYALRQSLRLAWDWERERDFTYDCVIATRYDLQFEERVRLEELPLDCMNTIDTGIGCDFALCDQFFVSSSKNMKVMSGLYEAMFEFKKTKDQFNTERNSFDLMVKNGIKCRLIQLPYQIIRG